LRSVIDDRVGIRVTLELLACADAARGRWQRAALLAGGADALWARMAGSAPQAPRAHGEADYEAVKRSIRGALGGARYDDAYASGGSLSVTDLIAVALADGQPGPGRPRRSPRASAVTDEPAARSVIPLSPREIEVARLIADGATNGETARRLFISERTVETHVASIFSKLGVGSRVQVARWVAQIDAAEAIR
jgi:non-specific serine/threonine protein kinase